MSDLKRKSIKQNINIVQKRQGDDTRGHTRNVPERCGFKYTCN